jgi:hypothetical protein
MEGMEKGSIKKSKYAPAGTGENAEVLRISIFPTADSALQEEGKSVPARPQIQQDVLPVNENDSKRGSLRTMHAPRQVSEQRI